MSTRKSFFEICEQFGHAPSNISARPAVEYRECVTFRGLGDDTEIQTHLQHECTRISPELQSQTTDITSRQYYIVLSLYLWRHHFHSQCFHYCLKCIFMLLITSQFQICIADQFFLHVIEERTDYIHYGFIFL